MCAVGAFAFLLFWIRISTLILARPHLLAVLVCLGGGVMILGAMLGLVAWNHLLWGEVTIVPGRVRTRWRMGKVVLHTWDLAVGPGDHLTVGQRFPSMARQPDVFVFGQGVWWLRMVNGRRRRTMARALGGEEATAIAEAFRRSGGCVTDARDAS